MRTLVIIPTYLEAENIAEMLWQIRGTVPHVDILVVDDSSPDGTADIAKAAAEELDQIDVLVRPDKAGLGGAYRAGFEHAFDHDYEVVVQMDADFSHDPASLPDLLAEVDSGADIAIGSRYVKGGVIPHWPVLRRLLSRVGNFYASTVLGLGVRDATGPTGPTSCARSRPAPPRPPATASSSSCPTGPSGWAPTSSRSRSPSTTGSGGCRRCPGTSSARPCRWSRGGDSGTGCCVSSPADPERWGGPRPQ
jgi:Glycosyl transferase family 2